MTHVTPPVVPPVGDDAALDADGLVALPGFVDAHVHDAAAVLEPAAQAAPTHREVTTVVLGVDGPSFAPSRSTVGSVLAGIKVEIDVVAGRASA